MTTLKIYRSDAKSPFGVKWIIKGKRQYRFFGTEAEREEFLKTI